MYISYIYLYIYKISVLAVIFYLFDYSFAYCRLPCHNNFTVQNGPVCEEHMIIKHFDFDLTLVYCCAVSRPQTPHLAPQQQQQQLGDGVRSHRL